MQAQEAVALVAQVEQALDLDRLALRCGLAWVGLAGPRSRSRPRRRRRRLPDSPWGWPAWASSPWVDSSWPLRASSEGAVDRPSSVDVRRRAPAVAAAGRCARADRRSIERCPSLPPSARVAARSIAGSGSSTEPSSCSAEAPSALRFGGTRDLPRACGAPVRRPRPWRRPPDPAPARSRLRMPVGAGRIRVVGRRQAGAPGADRSDAGQLEDEVDDVGLLRS